MNSFINEYKFIILFLVTTTILAGLSNLEVLNDSQLNLKDVSNQKILNPKLMLNKNSRAPAAIDRQTVTALEKTFFCNHTTELKTKPTTVQNNLVMLSFKMCKSSKEITEVTIKNVTNGFRAQIFQPLKERYKTDYIQLSEGSNNIILEVVLKDGQINRESLVILTGS